MNGAIQTMAVIIGWIWSDIKNSDKNGKQFDQIFDEMSLFSSRNKSNVSDELYYHHLFLFSAC